MCYEVAATSRRARVLVTTPHYEVQPYNYSCCSKVHNIIHTDLPDNMTSGQLSNSQWIRLLQIFSARMVSDVFGSGGAIWSFSQAAGVRNPDNSLDFWKPISLSVGFIFLFRWIYQIVCFVQQSKEQTEEKQQSSKGVLGQLMYGSGDGDSAQLY